MVLWLLFQYLELRFGKTSRTIGAIIYVVQMVSKIKHQQSKTQENQTVQLFLSFMLHADLDSKPTAFPWAKLFSYSCWAHIFFSIEWGISCVLVNTLYVDGKVFIRRFLESFNFYFYLKIVSRRFMVIVPPDRVDWVNMRAKAG